MRKLKLFFACLLMAVLSIGQMWADVGNLYYTMTTPKNSKNSAYAQTYDVTISNMTWNAPGNQNIDGCWRIGGKSLSTATPRVITGKTKMGDAIAKIEINHNGKSRAAVSLASVVVEVASDAAFTQDVVSKTYTPTSGEIQKSTAGTIEITPTAESWAKDSYYKITFNVINTDGSNGGLDLVSIKFYSYDDGSTPAKTLQTVAVSGTPTKTSYTAGEDFDPAGLTVTGHYSDNTDETITSGITWSYNPSQELALNQTSIGITATVSNIASEEYPVSITVAAAPAAVEYVLFSGDIEEGDYVIYYDGKAMKNTIASNRFSYLSVAPKNDKITNPDASIVWHIAQNNAYWTLYNESVNKYAGATGSNNQGKLVDANDATALWSISGSETYNIVNKSQSDKSKNAYLRNNGTYGFATYAQGTGGALSLYKKVDDQVAVVKPAILGDTYFLTSSEVSMVCTTEGAEIRYTLDGTDPTATSTLYENPFTLTATTTVKAIAVKGTDVSAIAEKEFTKATVKTVAEALAMSATDDVYVTGYISAITEVSTEHKNATYRISDDGTTTGEMIVYRGKYLNNADFTEENKNNIHVGDKVVVRGGLVEYQSAMQLATGNYLISIEYPEVAIPTFEPATEGFLESVEVSLACSTDGAEIRYTLDGTDPTATSALYENPFTLTETTTVKAVAIKGGTTTAVVSKTYTKQEVMTVTEALASSAATGVYVKGIISTITEVSTGYKNATYRISDNGTKTDEMIVYRGRYINNTDFTSEDQIELGDEVVVYGNLVEFQSAMQLATGNYLISLVRKANADLAWSAESVELTVGDEFNAPTLQNPNNIDAAEISIESNNIDLATVENGVVSLVENATGEATITATFNGNATYNATQVSYTISVLPATLTDYYQKVTTTADIVEGTYLIVYEGESVAFDGGLDDSDKDHKLDKASNTIAVDITTDHKIGVTSATEAATFYIDPTVGTIQSASGKYIGVTSNSNGLKTSDNASAYNNSFAIDGDGNAIIGAVFSESTMTLRYNTDSGQKRFRYYKTTGSPAGQLYKLANETIKDNPNLEWDKESIELTVGGLFISPELSHAQGITGTISYVSDNENVATVENGVISLVAEATGTAHITASYAGDENYKPGSAVCTIKVNPAHSIYVDKLSVNFGSVAKDASVDDQVITVTLTEVPNATATLSGSGASAYSIDPAALTASGTITISASTATVGTFNAKLTISDNAGEAEAKEVNLKLIVTDPASEETPISTSTEWIAATEITDGMQVLITGVKDEVVYAMGEQKSTNRAAYIATVDGEGVLTPGEGTMAFTLVAQGDGTYAIRTSNGKYLYAAKNDANHLKTQDDVDVNAKWTMTVASAVAEGSSNRNVMQFNGGSSKLFSCYASASQQAIALYVPKPVTPPTPQYELVRENLAANRYYTLCFNRTMEAVQGATFWAFASKDANMAYLVQQDAPYVAGTPYIIYAEAAGDLTAVLSGDVETNPGVNGALHGTFSLMEQTHLNAAGENIYLLMNNELRRVDGQSGNSLPANRAYIALDEIANTGAPANVPAHRVRAIPMHKDVVTGFENLNATDKPVKLLIDGNIYILRGEKMYDATGRLVK